MKKLLLSEIILVAIALICVIGSLAQILGFVAFTVMSLSLLSLYYLFFSFAILNGIEINNVFRKKAYQEIKASNILAGALLGFWVFSLSVIAIQFTLMQWEGADGMRMIALTSSIITLLIYGLILFKKNTINSKLIFFRALFYALIILLLHFY